MSWAWTPSTRPRSRPWTRSTPSWPSCAGEELAAAQERAALAARVEALHVGLNRKDASTALLAATDQVDGLLGSVAALVSVEASYETAVAAAFGAAADAVAVAGVDAAVGAFDHLKAADLGRAGLLLAGAAATEEPADWPGLAPGARYAVDVVDGARRAARAVQRVLRKVAVVADLPAAQALVASAAGPGGRHPRRGCAECALRCRWVISAAEPDRGPGGHRRGRTATDRGESRYDRLRFAQSQLEEQQRDASLAGRGRLSAQLHESDAAMAALAEELGQLRSTARSAQGEAERLRQGDRPGRAGPGLRRLRAR